MYVCERKKKIKEPDNFIKTRIKKTAGRLLVPIICLKSRENAKLIFLKKINVSRHAYKSTSSLSDGNTPKKTVVAK